MKFHNRVCCRSVALIVLLLGIADCHSIPNITECGITCSQGIHCKSKTAHDLFHIFCRDPPHALSPNVLENMKISTVMKCTESHHCSLHLNVSGTVTLDDHIRGVEICSLSLSTQQTSCMIIRFTKHDLKKFHMQQVLVQANCFEVGVSEQVYVTMKTVPDFCGVHLKEHYHVEGCENKDVGRKVRSCLSGKLEYEINEDKQSITVHVSQIPGDVDYHVRLCRKHFICHDIKAHALIKKEHANKSVTLQYRELLPCLCIEGWSAIPDARRTRVCPFKNDISMLWESVTYNSKTQVLAWEPPCPVNVKINLCWKTDEKKCVNMPNSQGVANKVSFNVTAHPQLCMKFTTDSGSWVKCPFIFGPFAVYHHKKNLQKNKVKRVRKRGLM